MGKASVIPADPSDVSFGGAARNAALQRRSPQAGLAGVSKEKGSG